MKIEFKCFSIALILLLFIQCDYRTSSHDRFSINLDIKIPKDAKVIKDEYQDMIQDYGIIYQLKLSETKMLELTNSIRRSKFYNQDDFLKNDNKSYWTKTEFGYTFWFENNRTIYTAKVDTINNTAEFEESSD